jgi:hypothetical protein
MIKATAAISLLSLCRLAAAEIDCNTFWSGGMPLRGHTGGSIPCEEYVPDESTVSLLGGFEYEIFLERGLENEAFHLVGNTLVSQGQGIAIDVNDDWLVREAEYTDSYVPFADFDPEALTFSIAPGFFGIHVSSYGIQQEGSAGIAWGRDLLLAINTETAQVIGRLPESGVTKSRAKYMGCTLARNDIFLLGDIDKDGAADIAVLPEEVRCETEYDPANDIDRVIESHHWGTMKWYVFDDSGWHYVADRDGQRAAQHLRRLPWPGLTTGPVDFALARSRRNLRRQPLPADIAVCVD